jgi:hypothetical protein
LVAELSKNVYDNKTKIKKVPTATKPNYGSPVLGRQSDFSKTKIEIYT